MRKKLSVELEEELAKLAAMPDEAIDFSDTPELTQEAWADAVRPGPDGRGEPRAVLPVDADVVAWFKGHVAEGSYQAEINRVLRAHMAQVRS